MSDRYRYPRPRSPTFNPARTSLPINISGWASDHHHDHHSIAIPSSRREVFSSGSRGSSGNASGVVTTYKVKTDPPSRGSSTRARRSSTMDSSSRPPAIITATNRPLRPVIHSGGARPASPMKNPYRSSEEEYYSVPSSSQHGHQHRKAYSATMDNADMSRLSRERDSNSLRAGGGREGTLYIGTRARPAPTYPASSSTRRSDAEDYGEDGYNYTGPRDLVQYDLNHSTPRHHARRDSTEGSRRPTSISGYNDIVPRSFDARERGPPPSTRGFDRIPDRTSTWAQPVVRMPVASVEPVPRPAPFNPIEPIRKTGSARPASMYHDTRDPRRAERGRDDHYEVRDDERYRKPHRQDTYDDNVEQRGFGIRSDLPEKSDRVERTERSERSDRPPRSERERYGREDDRTEPKGRDALTAGVSIAGAALGLSAAKNSISNRDDDRDDRRRREYEEDARRRERDERGRDLDPRDTKERRYREEDRDKSPREYPRDSRGPRDVPTIRDKRDIPPPPRDAAPPAAYLDPSARDSREQRPPSRGERGRDLEPSHRDRRFHPDQGNSAIDSGSDDATHPRSARRESRNRRESQAAQSFNPKDTMDRKALKDALNAQDTSAPPKIPPKEPISPPHRTPRGSMSRDPREVADIRSGLVDDRRSREINSEEGKQLRVVSPPRDKSDTRPIKSILRQPRAAFPEDPSPIREGVAPLKDAKKDGVPPDARWTKISRKLVNPEALEAGKERYEARDDFVIVLRVLSRDEVQGYAEVTQRFRAAREEAEALEREERRRARRERHRRERAGELPPRRRRRKRDREPVQGSRDDDGSESDTTEDDDDDRVRDVPRAEGRGVRREGEEAVMSGGLGESTGGR